MNLTGVAAMTADGCIGRNNKIPWHYKEDFQYFKNLTTGSTILMGKKTWDSLPKKPLPNRRNIVITRSQKSDGVPTIETPYFADIQQLDGLLRNLKEPHYIIGGGQVFEALWPFINTFYMTIVTDVVTDGDTFIPKKFFTEFKLLESYTIQLSPSCKACKYVRE